MNHEFKRMLELAGLTEIKVVKSSNFTKLKLPFDPNNDNIRILPPNWNDFLEKYWDFKRGLTENQKNVLQFSRKENGIIKETEYTIKNDTNSKTFIGYEIYLFSKRTGTSIFFNFPKDKKETYSSVWENLKNSLYFRGQKLAEK
jgi:hypothetical protein